MKQCATGIEIDTSVHDVPSSKARELTAINLKNNLIARGLRVTFDEHRKMAGEGAGGSGEADSLKETVDEGSERDFPGTTEEYSVKPVAAAASARTFIVVLPYTVDEFTADLQTHFKHAVAKTAGTSIEKVFACALSL